MSTSEAANPWQGLVWLLVGGAMLMSAAVLAGIGIVDKVSDVRPAHFVASTGTVVEVIKRGGGDSGPYYDSVIHLTAGGADYRFESALGTSDMRPGDEVTVWYDPSDPASTAETDEDRRMSLPSSLGFSIFFAAAATVPLWVWWQIRHETHPKGQ